jgi:hypothetical protein
MKKKRVNPLRKEKNSGIVNRIPRHQIEAFQNAGQGLPRNIVFNTGGFVKSANLFQGDII